MTQQLYVSEEYKLSVGTENPSAETLKNREERLATREKQVSEFELAAAFGKAVGEISHKCKNSVQDIKLAFADNRYELIALNDSANNALKQARRHKECAGAMLLLSVFIVSIPLYFSDRRAAKKHELLAGQIAEKVDIEVNRWKLVQLQQNKSEAQNQRLLAPA